VVTFYLLRDWDFLVERIRELIPRNVEPLVSELTKQCDQVLGAFMRGQLMVMLALGTIYAIGLGIIGIELALLLGMIAGLASIVPYLGFIIGILVSSVAAMMQFQDINILFYVAIVFTIGQLIEGFLLTPMLVGDKIGLHPVAVIFAIMAGGQLFGFAGVLLALPVAAVIMVLLRFAHLRYIGSDVYGKLVEKAKE
jgi:predicted PurR-regulated permease PerM